MSRPVFSIRAFGAQGNGHDDTAAVQAAIAAATADDGYVRFDVPCTFPAGSPGVTPSNTPPKETIAMQTGINIDGTAAAPTPESIRETADAIVSIFEAAYANHVEQANLGRALDVLRGATTAASGVTATISNATFGGDSTSRSTTYIDGEDVVDDDDLDS